MGKLRKSVQQEKDEEEAAAIKKCMSNKIRFYCLYLVPYSLITQELAENNLLERSGLTVALNFFFSRIFLRNEF